ncbi:MAG: hypothetical protein WB952_20775 [Terriglobales bacterium]
MRSSKSVFVIAICVLGLSVFAGARQNQFGVADSRNISFSAPIWVGTVLLPRGDYQVLHVMEGQDHTMVFRQKHSKNPAEARVKCQLVALPAKARRDDQTYELNAANERVLRRLVFQGDTAQHVF